MQLKADREKKSPKLIMFFLCSFQSKGLDSHYFGVKGWNLEGIKLKTFLSN